MALKMWDVILTDSELPDDGTVVTFASEGQAIAFMQGWNTATEYWDRPGTAVVRSWNNGIGRPRLDCKECRG